jgi:hypothetical protein
MSISYDLCQANRIYRATTVCLGKANQFHRLLRESCCEGGKVRTRTLANLTAWPPERIAAVRRALQGEFNGLSGDLIPTCGAMFAVLCV